jgi:hypothetical protein
MAASAEDRINDPDWVYPHKICYATDMAVGYAIEQGDPAIRGELTAVMLETTAAVHQALAQGAMRAAAIVAGKTAP